MTIQQHRQESGSTGRRPARVSLQATIVLLCCVQWAQHLFLGWPSSPSTRNARTAHIQREAGPAGDPSGTFSLRYFDGRGVAETIRMIFVVAGQEFEDKRYPISFGVPGDFSTIKREEFEADRAAGKMEVSMGKVPVLDAGPSFSLAQSKAIERYLAGRFGLMGSTPEEAAWVDAVCEHVRDVNDAYRSKGLFGMKDAEKKAEIEKKWFAEELPTLLKKLDVAVPGTDGFAVGGKTSLADIVIFKLLKDTYADRDVATSYADCPKLGRIVSGMDKHKGLQKWIAERPKTMF